MFYFAFHIYPFFSAAEQPGSLHSSQGFQMGPVEESWFSSSPEQPQEENERSVQAKLQEEASYHAFGRFTEKQAKPQPKQNVAYSREEERKRRVSHDPFAQQRPRKNVQSAEAKGFSDPSTASHGNTAHPLSGPASHSQVPFWNNGFYSQHGFGTSGAGVWYGPNPSQMFNTYKTPVPETNLPGSTPTIPFISLPLAGKQIFNSPYLVLSFSPENEATSSIVINSKLLMGTVTQSLQLASAVFHIEVVSIRPHGLRLYLVCDSSWMPASVDYRLL